MKLKTLTKQGRISFCNYNGDFQGCGYIRIIFPSILLPTYRYKNFNFSFSIDPVIKKDLNYYKHFSFVKFQRSATKKQLLHIRDIKNLGVNFLYEVDDLLTNIPEWNYASKFYKELEPYINEMMKMANGITVSTNKLKQIYSSVNSNIVVIPNRLPKFLWGDIYPKHINNPRTKKPVILWSGSPNHFAQKHFTSKSGGDFGKKLLNFICKTTDIYNWTLCGALPGELETIKDKIILHEWKNVLEYPSFVKSIEPDICIAPLEPCIFNKCKSDIKVLEYLSLGAAGVYTDIEPYKSTYLKAKNDEEMVSYIERLADDVSFRGKVFKKDMDKYRGQIFWEENNNLKQYINDHLKLIGKKLP